MKIYRCKVCGYLHVGSAPEECPIELDLVRGSAKLVRKVFRQEIPVEVVSSFRR